MKKVYLSLFNFLIVSSLSAQTIPTLPKEWVGEISGTSMGVAHKSANPNQSEKGWNTYDEVRKMTILRQEGRHLDMLIKNPRGEIHLIGTISKDGKQIIAADQGGAAWTLNLAGNTLSGCGATRGAKGTFDDWFNNYAALCLDLNAVK